MAALNVPQLIGGAVIIEPICAWPGMGGLAITAVHGRDYPLVMVINLNGAVVILLSSQPAALFYALIDPRINYS